VKEPYWLDAREVCAIHGEIVAETGGSAGLLNEGALDSTLNKPKNLYFYSDETATIYELAAAYAYGLIKNHCFVDGNKRIALIAAYTFLAINGVELNAAEIDAASFFLDLAASSETQDAAMTRLTEWLDVNSAAIE
jgi:death on curing protein